jgi:hypothetical protein
VGVFGLDGGRHFVWSLEVSQGGKAGGSATGCRSQRELEIPAPMLGRTPRITSWDILSRPSGTGSFLFILPRISSWATLSRPWRDWIVLVDPTQDYILGYSQPSLRDWIVLADP